MIYLASPYSSPFAELRESRYHAMLEILAYFLKQHIYAYSPIVHCHNLGLDGGFDFWESFDRHMIELSSDLTVVMLPGWEESKGVTAEIAYARELGKPVIFFNRARGLQ